MVHASMRPPAPQSLASTTRLQPGARKGSAFWLCFLAIVVCNILSALDVTAVSTVLPTITHDLDGDNNFVWVGAAYGLASTAALPLCGRLADVFGRRPIMLITYPWTNVHVLVRLILGQVLIVAFLAYEMSVPRGRQFHLIYPRTAQAPAGAS